MTSPFCGRERGKANRGQDHAAPEDQRRADRERVTGFANRVHSGAKWVDIPTTRVRRGFRYLRPKIGLPAGAPKPTRPGPGRPPGTPNRTRATRHHVGKTTKRATSVTAHRQETG